LGTEAISTAQSISSPTPAPAPASESSGPLIAKDNEIANTAKKALAMAGVALGAVALVAAVVAVVAAGAPIAATALAVGAAVSLIGAGVSLISSGINFMQANYKEAAWDLVGVVTGGIGAKAKGVFNIIISGIGLMTNVKGLMTTGAEKVPFPDLPPIPGFPPLPDFPPIPPPVISEHNVIEMEPVLITGRKDPEPPQKTPGKNDTPEPKKPPNPNKDKKTPGKSETPAPNLNQREYRQSKSAVVRLPTVAASRKNTS